MDDYSDNDSISTNPLYIIVFLFIFIIFVGALGYVTKAFLGGIPNPFAPGTEQNAIYQNASLAKTIFASSNKTINDSMIGVVLLALLMDGIIAYFHPDKMMGIVNIILVFVVPIIWFLVSGVLPYVSFLFVGLSSSSLYAFFISPYFIVVAVFGCIVSAVLNMRQDTPSNSNPQVYSGNTVMGGDRYG
jgi:hypothetical protein